MRIQRLGDGYIRKYVIFDFIALCETNNYIIQNTEYF